jgi:uncharacterized membrane protein
MGKKPEGKPPQEANEVDQGPDFEDILSKLPAGTPPEVVEIIAYQAYYSGPLPPPTMFAKYDGVLPGAADRILAMAEKEQAIRKRDNGWILFNDGARVWGSIVVSLALVAGGVYCGAIGEPWLGAALGGSGVIGVVVRAFNKSK